MARAFTQTEKAKIKDKLVETGNRLFTQFGLKKTSVDDIAREAGISKGSFYAFYKSKELLLWDVIEEVERQVRADIGADLFGKKIDKEQFKRFLLKYMDIMAEYPLIRQLISGGDYGRLMLALPRELLEEHALDDYNFSTAIVRSMADAGVRLPGGVDASGALLRCIFFIALHKREIGRDYEQGIDLLCEILAGSFSYKE